MATAFKIQDFDDPSYNPFLSHEDNFGNDADPYPRIHALREQGAVRLRSSFAFSRATRRYISNSVASSGAYLLVMRVVLHSGKPRASGHVCGDLQGPCDAKRPSLCRVGSDSHRMADNYRE